MGSLGQACLGTPLWRARMRIADIICQGVCAGLIMLAAEATNGKRDGQELIGGLDVTVARNFFGRQLDSFLQPLNVAFLTQEEPPFRAVFIRAPIIIRCGPGVEVVARIDAAEPNVVGVRQGMMLGTAFHPELTHDDRFHRYFLRILQEYKQQKQ